MQEPLKVRRLPSLESGQTHGPEKGLHSFPQGGTKCQGGRLESNTVQRQAKLLFGIRILITRPAAQANSLSLAIKKAGGVPLLFPVFKIIPILEPTTQNELAKKLQKDILIFTSPNAVSFLPKTFLNQLCLSTIGCPTLLAMGPSTQKALEQQGLTVAVEPKPPFNSEALLELSSLQRVHQKKIGVITGEGGRMFLREALQKKGGEVSCMSVYARQETKKDLLAFWKKHNPEIILTTSNEILQALYEWMRNKSVLLKTPLVVTSKRAMLLAEQLGFEVILGLPFYDEAKIIETIAEYVNGKRRWGNTPSKDNPERA